MGNENVGALKQRVQSLEDKVREQDAMLGRRPCQNGRCNELTNVRSLLSEVMNLHDSDCIATGMECCETTTSFDILAERIRAALAP